MSQSSRPNVSLPTSTSSFSSNSRLNSNSNSNSRLNSNTSTSTSRKNYQQSTFSSRQNSRVAQTSRHNTNIRVSPSNIFSSRLNTNLNTSSRLTTNVPVSTASSTIPSSINSTTFSYPRQNSDNILNTRSSTRTNTNTIEHNTLETLLTEILNRLKIVDLRLQMLNSNLAQQNTFSITSNPNSTQLPTSTTVLTTPTTSSTNMIYTIAPSTSAITPVLNASLTDVIQHYRCPFENNPELLCTYYERHTEDGVCPFGHQLNAFNNGIELTQLPMHLCLNYLLNECTNLLIESQSSQLVRCPDGLHLSSTELVDKKRLYEMLASEVLNMDAQQRQQTHRNNETETETINQTALEEPVLNPHENANQPDTNITSSNIEELDCCSICHTKYTSVEAFGLLENCDHAFCANCILMWYQSQSNQGLNENTCPNCRLVSTRLIIWSEPKIESAEQKAAVFEAQHHSIRI